MVWSLASIVTLVVGVITLAMTAIALHVGRRITRRSVAALLFAVGVWNVAYAIEIATPSLVVAELVGGVVKYAAVSAVPPILLIFVLRFTRRGRWISRPLIAALAIEHGCEWNTTDRGFARFPGLRWRHPLSV